MTPQRRAVLDVVRASHDHPTAEDIHRSVQRTAPGIGVATVYRTLDLLVRSGAVRELRLGTEVVARYDGQSRRHDHAICTGCGRVTDVEVALPDEVISLAGDDAGLDVTSYDLQLRGRCGPCRAA